MATKRIGKRNLLRAIKARLEDQNKEEFTRELLKLIIAVAKKEKVFREMMTLLGNHFTLGPKLRSRKSYIEHVAEVAERGVKRWSGQT